MHTQYCAFEDLSQVITILNIMHPTVLFRCIGRQAPLSGLCADDGGNSELLAEAKADSAVFCNFPTKCTKVHGKPVTNG